MRIDGVLGAFLGLVVLVPFGAMAGTPAAFSNKMAESAPPQTDALKGKVLETIDVDTYTYVKLATPSGETWAAVPKAKVKVGSEVAVANPMKMDGFESKTLKRKFDHMVFGTLADGSAAEMSAASMKGNMAAGKMAMPMGGMGGPHGGASGPVDLGSIKVAKAEGKEGRTVAEIFAQKSDLKDKKVAIRGKVVKVTSGILGKTWLHVRDGSGSEKQNNYDLIATITGPAKVGDVVMLKGTLHLDRDIGAGYKYPVLLEDATAVK